MAILHWFFHRWEHWQDGELIEGMQVQSRRCRICNKLQRRAVTIFGGF